jgi:hypothetical protein
MSRKKDFSDYCPAEKVCIFLAMRHCEKCTGKSNVGKKSGKGLIAKISANYLYQGSCHETPLYDHVLGNKRDSDKDEV